MNMSVNSICPAPPPIFTNILPFTFLSTRFVYTAFLNLTFIPLLLSNGTFSGLIATGFVHRGNKMIQLTLQPGLSTNQHGK